MAVELRRERKGKKGKNNNKIGKWVRWEREGRGKWERGKGDAWPIVACQRRLVGRVVHSEGWVSVVREKERRKEEGKMGKGMLQSLKVGCLRCRGPLPLMTRGTYFYPD